MSFTTTRLRESTLLKHDQSHAQPVNNGRKLLPKNATPSLINTGKFDPEISRVKADLRIQTYFIKAHLEIEHQTALNRGKTNQQGTRAPKGFQAAHCCLSPRTTDARTQEVVQRIVEVGVTPKKTLPFLKQRIYLADEEAMELEKNHTDERFVKEFITKRLPKDGIHSIISDTRFSWNCNATFENPDESNEFDSRMEKAVSKFLVELRTARLKGNITAEGSTEQLVGWLMDYYKKSVANLKQRQINLEETASSFDSMRVFELKHLGAASIPEDEFLVYLGNLSSFLVHYDALTAKEVGCPSIKAVKDIRHDFKFLRKIASMVEKRSSTKEIISYYTNTKHLGQEMSFDRKRFHEKYKLYQEEAQAQMEAVKVFTEPCTIPQLKIALFGKLSGGTRIVPSENELRDQLLALSMPATPIRTKISKRLKLKVVPFAIEKKHKAENPVDLKRPTKKLKTSR